MIKTATITKGVSTEAVNFVHDIVNKEQTDISPLYVVAWCERAIQELKIFKDNLKEKANIEYEAATDGKSGQLRVNSFAVLTHNSSKGYWIYPSALVKLETELKVKQAAAQKDGTAIKNEGALLNAVSDFLFKIQILDI